jgi:hypothetical protein
MCHDRGCLLEGTVDMCGIHCALCSRWATVASNEAGGGLQLGLRLASILEAPTGQGL